jgi:hypothetical protein
MVATHFASSGLFGATEKDSAFGAEPCSHARQTGASLGRIGDELAAQAHRIAGASLSLVRSPLRGSSIYRESSGGERNQHAYADDRERRNLIVIFHRWTLALKPR